MFSQKSEAACSFCLESNETVGVFKAQTEQKTHPKEAKVAFSQVCFMILALTEETFANLSTTLCARPIISQRISQVGRDSEGSLSPTPCSSQHYLKLRNRVIGFTPHPTALRECFPIVILSMLTSAVLWAALSLRHSFSSISSFSTFACSSNHFWSSSFWCLAWKKK